MPKSKNDDEAGQTEPATETQQIEPTQQKTMESLNATLLALMSRIEQLEATMASSNTEIEKKLSAPTKTTVKTEHGPDLFLNCDHFDDVKSTRSTSSHDGDVQEITALLGTRFLNQDQHLKIETDQLRQLQKDAKKRIPQLKYVNKEDSGGNPLEHNHTVWYDFLLAYFYILSPAFAEKVEGFISSINLDDLVSDQSRLSIPDIDDSNYSLVTRISAHNALIDSISEDFAQFKMNGKDGYTANIFATLLNLAVHCNPNSRNDRSIRLGEFWTMAHKGDECITAFAERMKKAARAINKQFNDTQINSESLYAATIKAVRGGDQYPAYKHALMNLKFNRSQSFDQQILWLFTNSDKAKLPAIKHGASMARTRGGKRGNVGKGRGGGKGGRSKGKGKGGKSDQQESKVVWKEDVYVVTDDQGNDQVAKPVANKKSTQVCCNQATKGKCFNHEDNDSCPYFHDFNIIDTRNNQPLARNNPSSQSSASYVAEETKLAPNASSSASNNQQPTEQSSASAHYNTHTESSDEDSAFSYAHTLGFGRDQHCSSVSVAALANPSFSTSNYLVSTLTDTTFICDILQFLFTMYFCCISLPYLCASLAVSVCSSLSLVCSLFYFGVSVLYSVSMNCVVCFLLPMLIQPMIFVAKIHFLVTNSIGSYYNIFYLAEYPLLQNFSSFVSYPVMVLFLALSIVVCRLSNRTPVFFSSAVSTRRALYQVILDCGCTFTMSGDYGLFVKSTLVPINEPVGLAESGETAKATHKGKIVVDGQLIDALYVPRFKQTMISMGQLERMGLIYTKVSESTRSFLTDKGDTFMSFFVAPNNLYPLLPKQSASAGSTSA